MRFRVTDAAFSDSSPIVAEHWEQDRGADGQLLFSKEEAEQLRDQLNDALEQLAPKYVQVMFALGRNEVGQPYTYEDPSGELEVGDFVYVPVGTCSIESMGKVVALGRGSYDGPIKPVSAVLKPQEL